MGNAKLPLKREYSAGGALFKRENGAVLWLVQERAGRNIWQIPKGHIEKGETATEAALREVTEETGVTARAIAELTPIKYFYVIENECRAKTVQWFLMEYASGSIADFDPREVSAVKFAPFAEAINLIAYDSEKSVLKQANELLNAGDFLSNLA